MSLCRLPWGGMVWVRPSVGRMGTSGGDGERVRSLCLPSDLSVTKTHSRPHNSNDNPYSEAHFLTLKYRPGCSQRFGNVQHAWQWAAELLRWYNGEHHHSGLGLMTPEAVHYGPRQRAQVASGAGACRRICDTPTVLRHGSPKTSGAPIPGLYQQTAGGDQLNSDPRCPILIDRYRTATALDAAPDPTLRVAHKPRKLCGHTQGYSGSFESQLARAHIPLRRR